MVEAMDSITDALMEEGKTKRGRGQVYFDTERRVYTADMLDRHVPKSSLNEAQAENVGRLNKSLLAEPVSRFAGFEKRPFGGQLKAQLDTLPAENQAARDARLTAIRNIIMDPEFNIAKIQERCRALKLPDDILNSILNAKREQVFIMQTTDRLTGVYSKPGIATEIEAAINAGKKPVLYEIEPIGKAKPLNEMTGHFGGDTYMVYMARAIEGFCVQNGLKLGRSGVNFLVMSPKGPVAEVVMARLRSIITETNQKLFSLVDQGWQRSPMVGSAPVRELVGNYIITNIPLEAAQLIRNFDVPKVAKIPLTSAGKPAIRLGPDGLPLTGPAGTLPVGEVPHPVPGVDISTKRYKGRVVPGRRAHALYEQTAGQRNPEARP
jgi:GGDEF domain-containing protein